MPSRLDALRARLTHAGNHYATLPRHVRERATAQYLKASLDDLAALLAVVEAAQDYRRNSLILMGQDAIGAALDTALAAWTTEEGDHLPGAGNMVAATKPLLDAAIAALEPDAVCRAEDEHTDTPACLVCRGCALRTVLDAARRAPV